MCDFDGDELAFLISSGIAAIAVGMIYWIPIFSISLLGRRAVVRILMAFWPLSALAFTYFVIQRWSDVAVKDHPDYILLFLSGAGAWLAIAAWVLGVFGISVRGDAIERDNLAATIAIGGTLWSVGIVYALSNIGSGSTIWTTLVPAFVGTVVLGFVFLMIQWIGGSVIENVTIDRDLPSALRLAGALIGSAIILGRAIGGNWQSWNQTWHDMVRYGWPICLLAIIAGIVHRLQRPSPLYSKSPVLGCGLVPALGFVLASLAVVALTPHGLHPSKW